MMNFDITPPNGNIGTMTTAFFDFIYLQTLEAYLANISYTMYGIFVRSSDPLILLAEGLRVDVDYSNQAFWLTPSCNYPEANLFGEVIIWNSTFKGTLGKQVEF